MALSRIVGALACALAAAVLGAPTALAGERCAPPGYSYSALIGHANGHGVAATVTALAVPTVESGHVAAWVGVGGRGQGPGGSDEWLQVGLNSLPGTGNRLYYELALPGEEIRYVELDSSVPAGRAQRVAVLETSDRPDYWRVWVDGAPATDPILLPGSHGRLVPMATAESWDGGAEACNRYRYRFGDVALATAAGGVWRPFTQAFVRQDPGHELRRAPSGFLASAGPGSPVPETGVPTRAVALATGSTARALAADDIRLRRVIDS